MVLIYFEKRSKLNSNEFISIGKISKTIDLFYFSSTRSEFDADLGFLLF
jgi:hypothetical protein